ncbi:MAG: insulinase family protein [Armatimonadetes bacterium]|nr:insulinase family protein [Armatimonadota bacterium]
MRYDRTTLANGLDIVGEYNEEALSMACGFFCRTGARDETAAESGVSHFLEHMMFKGTDRLSYDDINKTFDAIGARYNAFTSEENTVYYGQVLPEYQERLLGLLSEMMRPALRGSDFDMEKNVILEEIAMYADQPLCVAADHCRELHYGGHGLGQRVLGTNESIKALTRDQMADYFDRRYASDNLTLAFSGRYDWDAAVAQVAKACGGWSPSGAARNLASVVAGVGATTLRYDRFQQVNVYLMAPGLAAQDDRRLTASIAAAAIGSGDASRLHWALVDPGLAESAGLYHDEEDQNGTFSGVLVCQPEGVERAVEVYKAELERAQRDGLTADEVKRAQRRFGSAAVFQAESPLSRLVSVGMDWVYRGRITAIDEWLERLRAVTVDDCNALLAERPFDKLAMVSVGPVGEPSSSI